MQRRRWHRIGTGVAVAALAVGIAAAVVYHRLNRSTPVWVPGVAMYGAVFLVFLGLDEMSRSASRQRLERDAQAVRPRPRPHPRAASRPAAAAVPDPAGASVVPSSVRLVRARPEDKAKLTQMRLAERAEVLALDGCKPPPEDEVAAEVAAFLEEGATHAFFIVAGEHAVGCAVARPAQEEAGDWYRVESLYVVPAWRDRHIGRQALRQLAEFCRLAGAQGMVFHISPNNGRARHFLTALGYQLAYERRVSPDSSGAMSGESTGAKHGAPMQVWLLHWGW